jgi:hypothetical protein
MQSRSKFVTNYTWGTNGVCECKMDVKSTWIEWIMFHGHLDYFQKPSLGGRCNTNMDEHGTPNAHTHCFILFHHVWGPTWIEIHWEFIRLRAQPHMVSHYTWGCVTILHDFGGVLERPLDTFTGLSQFHGHSSWLMCEVALASIPNVKHRNCIHKPPNP